MKQRFLLLILFVIGTINLGFSQVLKSSKGEITFYSSAPLENIEAENKMVNSVIDLSTGEIAFSIHIVDFSFDKKLMQKHFQNKYMEVSKYPKSTFSGRIDNWDSSNEKNNFNRKMKVKGNLTIHGVTKRISEEIELEKNENSIRLLSDFYVKVNDFDIKVPKLMFKNIAENVKISVNTSYEIQ